MNTKTKTPKKIANNRTYATPSLDKIEELGIDAICEKLAMGESQQSIADSIGVSHPSLYAYIARPEHVDKYARSHMARAEKLAEDILAIADESDSDTYEDEHGNTRTDHEVVARSRLRVDARKWLAAKMFPKKYSDKIEQTVQGPDGGAIQIQHKFIETAEELIAKIRGGTK